MRLSEYMQKLCICSYLYIYMYTYKSDYLNSENIILTIYLQYICRNPEIYNLDFSLTII